MTCRPQTLNLLPQHCTLKTEYDSKTSPCSSHYEQVKGAWSSSIATTARENNGTLVRLGLKPRDDAPTSMGRGWNACVPLTRGLGIDSIYNSVRKEVYEMNCTQKQQLVCFPKVRVYKPWFRHFNDHKDFRNEGTVHLFSLMALFSYANFRSNERVINDDRYMEAPGQWICKLGALPRILRVHSKTQALELMEYFENHGFLTFEILDEEKEILRFTIADWKEHCTHLQYNYYSYKGSGFFFFPLPVGRLLLKTARKEVGIVFSELDAIMDMWLHTILNDPSLICSGKGNEDWNCSAPHGAGRLMSRKAAFNALSMEEFQKEMEGIYTTCVVPDTLDESPMAYKSMEEIVAQIGPTAEIIERIRPVYNFKAAD